MRYSPQILSQGALLAMVLTASDGVDFSRSVLFAINESSSYNYTIPFSLSQGHFLLFVYDIQLDWVLSSGLNYPAVSHEFSVSGNDQGT